MPSSSTFAASAASTKPTDAKWGMTIIRVVRAEFTKLFSLRSSLAVMAATVLVSVGASWALTRLIKAAYDAGRPEDTAGLEAGSAFLVILHYGQIGAVLLAAWAMHQENDPGCLRSTLLSTPQRVVVFAAKAILIACVSAVIGTISAFGAAAVRCSAIACDASGSAFAPTTAAELRILLGVVAYWILIALFTYALAVLLRSGLAAMGIVLALSLAVSLALLNITPLARYLPDQAGAQLYQQPPILDGDLGPVTGGLVLLAWTSIALLAALVSFHRQPITH